MGLIALIIMFYGFIQILGKIDQVYHDSDYYAKKDLDKLSPGAREMYEKCMGNGKYKK